MIILNLDNVEELVFYNKELRDQLPEFHHMFNQWKLAKAIPAMRNLSRRTVLDFLNEVNDEHIFVMKEYFSQEVAVNKLDYHIVKNIETSKDELEELLNSQEWYSQFDIHREGDQIYLSFWR